ncbi:hypothetical protein C8J56DRAFT_1048684 [Mycena floridula]|nr:hypothetical protein C8J56DRAFT_1048684 [Mycena floridula]
MPFPTIGLLRVPAGFSKHETIEDEEIMTRLGEWKQKSSSILDELLGFLVAKKGIPLVEQVDIIIALALLTVKAHVPRLNPGKPRLIY